MDFPEISSILGVLSVPDAEVEAQLDQYINVAGLWIGGFYGCFHDGMNDAKRGVLLLFYWWSLDSIDFKLMGEVLVHYSVGPSVWSFSGIGEAIQEVGHQNFSPYLINQLFLKSVQALCVVVII